MYVPSTKNQMCFLVPSVINHFTSRKYDLKQHTKRHNDIVSDHNIPPKIARHEPIPNIIEPTENEKFLSDIEQQEHTDILNTQAGLGWSQIPPTTATSSPPPVDNNNNNNNDPRLQEFERFFIVNILGEMIMNQETCILEILI